MGPINYAVIGNEILDIITYNWLERLSLEVHYIRKYDPIFNQGFKASKKLLLHSYNLNLEC